MKRSKIFYVLLLAALVVTFSEQVLALDLQQARTQGIIAEQPDGFVRVVKPGSGAEALADQVNAARRQEYQRISKENGQPIDVVAKIAASEIAKKLNSKR
ncbi:MAG TPA: DUF1318 domain-containing protein [Alphaproteobacteria bacterium]|nr:DUF1318 domain-containing protein [Alphaproteobacteria bacterium]